MKKSQTINIIQQLFNEKLERAWQHGQKRKAQNRKNWHMHHHIHSQIDAEIERRRVLLD